MAFPFPVFNMGILCHTEQVPWVRVQMMEDDCKTMNIVGHMKLVPPPPVSRKAPKKLYEAYKARLAKYRDMVVYSKNNRKIYATICLKQKTSGKKRGYLPFGVRKSNGRVETPYMAVYTGASPYPVTLEGISPAIPAMAASLNRRYPSFLDLTIAHKRIRLVQNVPSPLVKLNASDSARYVWSGGHILTEGVSHFSQQGTRTDRVCEVRTGYIKVSKTRQSQAIQ